MRRFATLAVVAGLAITSCSDPSADSDDTTVDTLGTASTSTTTSIPAPDATPTTTVADDPATTATTTTTTTTEEPASDPTSADPVSDADLVNFLAAAEAAIEGTRHEGVVLEEPETYIALAQAACARFSDDDPLDEIARDMLGEIDSADPTDDERLVGAILGAGTRTICPEHSDKI